MNTRSSCRQGGRSTTFTRRLRVEPLEDRRLLATITVDTVLDENDGATTGGISLRDAIVTAAPGDTIAFAESITAGGPATIDLLHGEIAFHKNLTINGPGAHLLTIDASWSDVTPEVDDGEGSRIFKIGNPHGGAIPTVFIRGLTLTGGDPGDIGGAIHARANLTVESCVLSDNAARFRLGSAGVPRGGGGVQMEEGSLDVLSSRILNNTTLNDLSIGGGIASDFGPVTIVDSEISGNTTGVAGGGLAVRASLSIHNSQVSGNRARISGGGVWVSNLLGGVDHVSISNSTIDGNVADVGGGVSSDEHLTLVNSTISGNFARSDGGGLYLGYTFDPGVERNFTISNSTIAGNSAARFGEAFTVVDATVNLANSIVTGNIAPILDGNLNVQYSLLTTNVWTELEEAPLGSPDAYGNLIGGSTHGYIDPLLGPLAENGGPTKTHALLPGSPALDASDPSILTGFDQRGLPRVFDGDGLGGARADIGAFELQPIPPAVFGDYNGDGGVNAADYVLWRKTLGTSAAPPFTDADGSGNGAIGPEDYPVWTANFGNTPPTPGAGSGAITATAVDEAMSLDEPTTTDPLSILSTSAFDEVVTAAGNAIELLFNSATMPFSQFAKFRRPIIEQLICFDAAQVDLLLAVSPANSARRNEPTDPLQKMAVRDLSANDDANLLAATDAWFATLVGLPV